MMAKVITIHNFKGGVDNIPTLMRETSPIFFNFDSYLCLTPAFTKGVSGEKR